MEYKIAVAQMDTGADQEKNLDTMESLAKEAALEKVSLVVFPERADYMGGGITTHAHPIPGQVSMRLSKLSKELGIYLLCGLNEAGGEKGRPFNSAILLDPEGEEVARYRKLHLFQTRGSGGIHVDESRYTSRGEKTVTADTSLGRLGLSICYDLRFPEMYRAMALQGAEVIFVCADFTRETGREHWELLLRARAAENCCYMVASNQCGTKPKYHAYGHSMVVDPEGKVLTRAEEGQEGLIYAKIDTDRSAEVRSRMPVLDNVRRDLFG